MRKAWLPIGMIVLISTACSHAPIETGVAPSGGTVGDRSSAIETPTALYVIDGVLVMDVPVVSQPIAPAPPPARALYMIDGVLVEPP
jgi:hypothetical protein